MCPRHQHLRPLGHHTKGINGRSILRGFFYSYNSSRVNQRHHFVCINSRTTFTHTTALASELRHSCACVNSRTTFTHTTALASELRHSCGCVNSRTTFTHTTVLASELRHSCACVNSMLLGQFYT